MTPLSQQRLKTNNCVALAHFSLEAETSPGAKNPCDVLCALGLVWFSSGHSRCSDFRILCAPHIIVGDINCLLAVLSRCSWWISSRWLMGSQSTYFVCQFYPWLGLSHNCPTFQRWFFFYLFICSPITLLGFSASNDRAVREWLMSRGWTERCNLRGSSPFSGEFSAAKGPAGIIDLAVPID